MNAPKPEDSLSRTLADWRVTPRRDPQFRTEVHARLEAARRAPSWGGYVRMHAAPVTGALAVAVAAGGLIGREQAKARVDAERTAMVSSYVQSLDARTMRMP